MKVELLHVTPLELVIKAIRKCYDSGDKSDSGYFFEQTGEGYEWELGSKDKALIRRIIDSGHMSTIEHLNFTFDLSGYSRALLQEKSRHRIASVSERSTRYCLGQLKKEESFILPLDKISYMSDTWYNKNADKYLVFTGIREVDKASIMALEALRLCVVNGVPNDKAKYCLPDSLVSECIFTINARSFRNWLQLRTCKRALWEIRELAFMMYEAIPEEYKFMFEDCIDK